MSRRSRADTGLLWILFTVGAIPLAGFFMLGTCLGCLFAGSTKRFFNRARAACSLTLTILLAMVAGCNGGSPVLARLMEAQRLSTALLVEFTKAADASNLAVMADTEEAAARYAHEAKQTTQAAQRDLEALKAIVRSLEYAEETAMLEELSVRYAKYRALDLSILELAVEGSNLKAQRLSFGSAMSTAQAFEDALAGIVGSASESERWRVQALAITAVAGVREIQVFEAPHIATAEDAVMTSLEKQMAASEADARRALAALGNLDLPGAQPGLQAAASQLDAFLSLNTQIIALSRRNTNVRSLALALGQKRLLTAACEDGLRVLQKALLARRDTPATR